MVDGVNNQTSLLKGATIAAATGATVGMGVQLYAQHKWLKNPVENADKFTRMMNRATVTEFFQGKSTITTMAKNLAKNGLDTIKSGKFNWKLAGMAAATDAVIVGGAYLAYRGVKALFTKSDKA